MMLLDIAYGPMDVLRGILSTYWPAILIAAVVIAAVIVFTVRAVKKNKAEK